MGWPELAVTAGAKRASWAAELTEAVPTLVDLGAIGENAPAPEPVLSHNNLVPGNVRLGTHGRLIVVGWEHAGGQPPSWELGNALMNWAVDPGRGVNKAGARALVDGYRARAGSLPALDMAMFRGAVTSLANYVLGQLEYAMNAGGNEDQQFVDRNVRHLLSHVPTRATLEQLLDVALVAAHASGGSKRIDTASPPPVPPTRKSQRVTGPL